MKILQIKDNYGTVLMVKLNVEGESFIRSFVAPGLKTIIKEVSLLNEDEVSIRENLQTGGKTEVNAI